jgi:hypothetical protein
MPDVRGRRGRARLPRLVAALAILAVPAALSLQSAGAAVSRPQARLGSASSTGDTKCVTASNRTTTCTGTYGGDRAWEWKKFGDVDGAGAEAPATEPPTVTVTPTSDLVSQVVHVSWTNFTPTLDFGAVSGNGNLEAEENANTGTGLYDLAIYECKGTDPQGPVGDGDLQVGNVCYDVSDTTQVQASAGAANGVIAFTSPDGKGSANVYVEAGPENSLLGCGDSTPCSLVVVPNWGGQEPAFGLPAACGTHTSDDGSLPLQFGAYTFIGNQCSWADRIVVPLSFAPSSANCPLTSQPVFEVDGTPMMEPAMEQWQAGWCVGKNPLSFGYTVEDDYQARELFLNGSGALGAAVDMALVTQPATQSDSNGALPNARQYTYAPLANAGIALAYYIDNPNTGQPYTNLVLNARLVAKLLTESYALGYDCSEPPPTGQKPPPAASSTCDPAVSGNPDSIFDDPEFYDLNGGDTAANIAQFPNDASFVDTLYGVFLPTVDSGNSDMTYDLTQWIEADPAAHAFLSGTPVTGTLNSGGQPTKTTMKVNTYYNNRNGAYPASSFVPLDPGWSIEPTAAVGGLDESMQAAWNPVVNLDTAATDLATYASASESPVPVCALSSTSCSGNVGYKNATVNGQFLGQDEMTAVVSTGQAAADAFPVFDVINAAGKAVAPTNASILAAVSQMTTNADGITQSPNFASKDAAAYPLAMVDYAMVPTCGLSAVKTSQISTFLTNVATTGQDPGDLPGQLAPGYVPLNSHQLGQLKAAASEVEDKGQQQCPKSGGHNGSGGNGDNGGNGGGGSSGGGSSGSKGGGTKAETTATPGSKPAAHNAGYAVKDPFTAGLERLILPLLIIMGCLLGLGGPVTYAVARTGGWAALSQRIGWPALHQQAGTLPHRLAKLVRGTRVRGS